MQTQFTGKHNQPSLIHLFLEHGPHYSHSKPYTLCRGCTRQSLSWLIPRWAACTFWANSSVTLTEELLKPKWLVRASCRTRHRWLLILHYIPHCSSSLSIGPDPVLTCGVPDGVSVWGGKKKKKKQVPRWWCLIGRWGISSRRAVGVNSRNTWLLIKAGSSGCCTKQIAQKWMKREEKKEGGWGGGSGEGRGLGVEWWMGMAEERCAKLVEGDQRKWFIH